ncbi:MAG: UDP-N-acetylmuramoyl-tripeptide--D-alanyl-D-alanine ligase [Candidatus Omnitrophica bacterium]|nr:UDP-N-acetylmuramoyl-tripeptide--D-alanyl-D-alanine ligase [Candidatus Omnitrophota bacterium]
MRPVAGVCLDSRRIQPDEAFIAIRGLRFDGHTFLSEATDRGAACLIVSQAPQPVPDLPTIRVSDTTHALGAIAAFHRSRFQLPVIAITGSCGKTTTKELLAHLVSQDRQVLKTLGTQNNHIGLPLTLLRLSASHEVAVVELGSNHPGEIAYLAQMAKPTMAVITNVGPAHLGHFGSLMEVLKEKLSLLEALGPDGIAVLPGDQLEVLLEARKLLYNHSRVITFGTADRCEIQALDIRRQEGGSSMRVRGVSGTFTLPLPGDHNLENTLAALACLKMLGISLESVQERMTQFAPLPLRSQFIRCHGLMIVNDCYNANPLSFARALEVLHGLEAKRKVVIAGDMLELGAFAQGAHQTIGRLTAQLGIEVLIAVGAHAEDMTQGASELARQQLHTFRTVPELLEQLPGIIHEGDAILLKGSRRLQLEQVTDFLLQRFSTGPSTVDGPQSTVNVCRRQHAESGKAG